MNIEFGKIYDDLLNLHISLNFEDIPTPSYIQERIIECNNHQRKVEKYEVSVRRQLSQRQSAHNTEKFNVESKKRVLITNNDRIKRLPTGREREAAADEFLENENKELMLLENEVNELKNLLAAIKTVQSNLKTTNSDIKLLIRIMEQAINHLNIGQRDDKDVKELQAGFTYLEKLDDEITLDDVESSEEIDSENESGMVETGPVEINLEEVSDERQISDENTKRESAKGNDHPEEASEESTEGSDDVVAVIPPPKESGDSPGTNGDETNENPASQEDFGEEDSIEDFIDSILEGDLLEDQNSSDQSEEEDQEEASIPQPKYSEKTIVPEVIEHKVDIDIDNIDIDIDISVDAPTDEPKIESPPLTEKTEVMSPPVTKEKTPRKSEEITDSIKKTDVVDVDLDDILSSLD